ncbi:MAG: TauD/TfdA family dioxygenase [Proteobacteria bacterium]|nr:TauD/TfdA family dioxygenase [Pseudomonadota bacterium]MDA1059974.1 TauD/TfdA family dioxygenase [Pseudomonadota bacterium]
MIVTPLSPVMGAEILGVDVAHVLGDSDFETVRRALLDHNVIAIRDQHLTPAQHVAFSQRFGDLMVHVKAEYLLPGQPEVLVLSNKKHPDGRAMGFEDAGRYWHSDMSYVDEPPLGSLLYAVEIPPEGGDTLFCNMYRAYETLPNSTKKRLVGLRAAHSYVASFEGKTSSGYARDTLTDEQKAQLREVIHPVVRTHPETGRPALYVNPGFTLRIEDLPQDEAVSLLDELIQHMTQPAFQYRHVWKPHDLVFWDNRCTMHHATTYDPSFARHMHRTTVRGDRPFAA